MHRTLLMAQKGVDLVSTESQFRPQGALFETQSISHSFEPRSGAHFGIGVSSFRSRKGPDPAPDGIRASRYIALTLGVSPF
jgi:hypothetical protein